MTSVLRLCHYAPSPPIKTVVNPRPAAVKRHPVHVGGAPRVFRRARWQFTSFPPPAVMCSVARLGFPAAKCRQYNSLLWKQTLER
jgi:hypothetical protein